MQVQVLPARLSFCQERGLQYDVDMFPDLLHQWRLCPCRFGNGLITKGSFIILPFVVDRL